MSRIKSSLLGFIILCTTTITAFSQNVTTEPPECKNGYGSVPVGGDFTINPAIAACINYTTNSSKVVIANYSAPDGSPPQPGSTKFIFNYKPGPPLFPNAPTPGPGWDTTYTQPGTYWIMMRGQHTNGSDYLKCKSIEVLQTPELKLDYDICTAGVVTVKILPAPENQVYNAFWLDWGDGTPAAEYPIPNPIPSTGISLSHTYTVAVVDPKIQGLHLRSNVKACFGNVFTIPVTNSNIPKITVLEGLNGGSENKITVKGGNAGSDYNIEMSTGNGTWTSTGKKITAPAANNTASVNITGLTGTNDYCFRLQKTGMCSTPIVSDPVCTIKSSFQVLTPKDAKVEWSSKSYNPPSSASITEYKIIYREYPTLFNYMSVNVNVSDKPTFTIDVLDCSKKYEVWIEGSWGSPSNKVKIISPPFIIDPNQGGKLPNALISFASVKKDEVRITMYTNGAVYKKYNIYKSEGNADNFKPLISLNNTNSYDDGAVEQTKQQYCYRAEYEDACGNKSELSDPFCTIFLTSTQSHTINWTPFIISDPTSLRFDLQPIEYIIQIINDNEDVIATPGSTFNTEFDVQQSLDNLLVLQNGKVSFRVLARQGGKLIWDGNTIDFPLTGYSNTYTFISSALLYVPTAFTPNDDTFNDVFKANGKFISEFNMVIYNRWGAPIFESKDMEKGWDGTDNGTPAPPGNYSYKIFGLDNAGQEFKKVGSVVLLK